MVMKLPSPDVFLRKTNIPTIEQIRIIEEKI